MSKFKIGDSVVVMTNDYLGVYAGDVFEIVLRVPSNESCFDTVNKRVELEIVRSWPSDFKKVVIDTGGDNGLHKELIPISQKESDIAKGDDLSSEELGVYRPDLETRKVGKVRVELVDDGFPLALREVAKVMTWAQTAKGYKDHDWQNLPNPEQGLSGATSRHRTDNIIQRQVGKLAAVDCVDHESKLVHKAHEAFGVLAQLELILRGVIK